MSCLSEEIITIKNINLEEPQNNENNISRIWTFIYAVVNLDLLGVSQERVMIILEYGPVVSI